MPARGRARSSKPKFKLTQEALLTEKSRSGRGGRKGLFWRAPSKNGKAVPFTQEMRFLPAFANRGPNGHELPFFTIGQHAMTMKDDEGNDQYTKIICTDFLRREQPLAIERYEKSKVKAITEGTQCLICHVLDTMQEEDSDGERVWHSEVPPGQWGNRPAWALQVQYAFAIQIPQDDFDDEDPRQTYVQIYIAPQSVKNELLRLAEKERYQYLFDPDEGWDVEVERFQQGKGPWRYACSCVGQEPIWNSNWEEEMPDLEEQCVNWMTREELLKWMEDEHSTLVSLSGIGSSKGSKSGSSPSARKRKRSTTKSEGTGSSTPRSRKPRSKPSSSESSKPLKRSPRKRTRTKKAEAE